ncbi:Hypothetical predicted protein [Paramuricea clavata]|uniref:Uncharacterized protein n=1 Tax=Paramuricea clavata TaxID=317549 RepID=A0A6S7HER6_PARCT|nr:Hypothetical predicted protein [Paramuricea clavata]
MRVKTDDGKDVYDLWFILEERGPNKGSAIEAYCKCKGGRDGRCKHIASAMYSLEALLNSRGEESVTSRSCQWRPKPQSNSEPCEIKDVVIEKESQKEKSSGIPVILPPLQKLYMSSETLQDHASDTLPRGTTDVKSSKHQGIMKEKVDEYLKKNKEITPENFKETLMFTDREIEEID